MNNLKTIQIDYKEIKKKMKTEESDEEKAKMLRRVKKEQKNQMLSQ